MNRRIPVILLTVMLTIVATGAWALRRITLRGQLAQLFSQLSQGIQP